MLDNCDPALLLKSIIIVHQVTTSCSRSILKFQTIPTFILAKIIHYLDFYIRSFFSCKKISVKFNWICYSFNKWRLFSHDQRSNILTHILPMHNCRRSMLRRFFGLSNSEIGRQKTQMICSTLGKRKEVTWRTPFELWNRVSIVTELTALFCNFLTLNHQLVERFAVFHFESFIIVHL